MEFAIFQKLLIFLKDPKTSFYKNCKSIIIQRNIVNIDETENLECLNK